MRRALWWKPEGSVTIFTQPDRRFRYLPSVGEEVKVYTYLHVREDAMLLFGFLTKDELKILQAAFRCQRDRTEGSTCDSVRDDDR